MIMGQNKRIRMEKREIPAPKMDTQSLNKRWSESDHEFPGTRQEAMIHTLKTQCAMGNLKRPLGLDSIFSSDSLLKVNAACIPNNPLVSLDIL